MSPGQIIYEGKAKSIITTEDQSVLIQYFKDSVTAFNKEKHEVIQDKGIINNHISAFIMQELERKGINTHFIKVKNEREQFIKKLKIIPLEVVIRNITAGGFCKRFKIEEGQKLKDPIVEFFYKNDDLADPMVNESHILHFHWLSNSEIEQIKSESLKINELLTNLFLNIGINLVDLKLEFGRLIENNKTIILADEISPDNCRLWDKDTCTKMDKDIFRLNLGDLKESYLEVARRLKIKIKC